MELGYVLSALGRRWWVVLVCGALGIFGARWAANAADEGIRYESHALLLVQPPSGTGGGGDPNRYISAQLSVMQARTSFEKVAAKIGNGETTDSIARAITVLPQPNTDLVTVAATATRPERAQLIAQTFVEEYISTLQEQAARNQGADLDEIDARLDDLEAEIRAVNAELAKSMEPYLTPTNAARGTIDPAFIDPENATKSALLFSQFQELQKSRFALEQTVQQRVNTEIVQSADIPTMPIIKSDRMLYAAGVVGGLGFGLLVALLWSRFSPIVPDQKAVGDIVGGPVVGRLPRTRSLKRLRPQVLTSPPSATVAIIDQLCVRAEASATVGTPLTVAVVGTQRASATTTIAMLMAQRFAADGSAVTLVDADVREPDLTRLFARAGEGGIPALLAQEVVNADRGREVIRRPREVVYSRTPNADVRLLGVGELAAGRSLRRDAVAALLSGVTRSGPIVVVDGGPVLDASSTVELCKAVDAVVLAVPMNDQRTDALQVVVRQLQTHATPLAVVTNPVRRRRRRKATGTPDIEVDVHEDDTTPQARLAPTGR